MGWRRWARGALASFEGAALGASRAAVARGIAAAERAEVTYAWYAVALRRIAIGALVVAGVLLGWRLGVGLDERVARTVDTGAAAAGLTFLLTAGGSGIAARRSRAARARADRLRRDAGELA